MSGTQYVNLDEPAFIVGNAQMFSDAGVMKAVSDTNPLPVSGAFSITGGATEAKQDSQIAQVWEVQANPTANTVLDRLKTIGTLLAATLGIGGNVAHDAADSGNPVKIGGKASSTAPTAVAANDRVDAYFDLQGRQIVAAKSTTGTTSNVASSATSVTLLASNTARLWATIHNDSTAILYVKFGVTASTSSYTVKMVADAYYEVPFGYTGIIDGIWASANGSARITELTA